MERDTVIFIFKARRRRAFKKQNQTTQLKEF